MQYSLIREILCGERRGKSVDCSRLTAQVLAGPNRWHYQRTGLAGQVIEVITHRLGLEDLPLRDKSSTESMNDPD